MINFDSVKHYLFGFILGFPLFIHIGPGGFSLGQSVKDDFRTSGVDLPISFVIFAFIVVLLFVFKLNSFWKKHNIYRLIFLLVFLIFFAYLYGNIFGQFTLIERFTSFAFFIQTIFPFFIFIYSFHLFSEHKDLYSFLRGVNMAILISCVLLILSNILIIGKLNFREIDYFGPIYITKIKRYYPTMVAFSFSYYCSLLFLRFNFGRLVLFLVFTITMLFSWSRSAFMMALITPFLFLIVYEYYYNSKGLKTMIVLIIIGLILFPFLWDFISSTSIFDRINQMGTSQGAGKSDSIRYNLIFSTIENNISKPFGQAFVPTMSIDNSGVRAYDFKRIGVPENVYLDYIVRSGLLSLILIIIFIRKILNANIHLIKIKEWSNFYIFIFSFNLAIVFFSNFTQMNYSEPYISIFLFALYGGIYKLYLIESNENK